MDNDKVDYFCSVPETSVEIHSSLPDFLHYVTKGSSIFEVLH